MSSGEGPPIDGEVAGERPPDGTRLALAAGDASPPRSRPRSAAARSIGRLKTTWRAIRRCLRRVSTAKRPSSVGVDPIDEGRRPEVAAERGEPLADPLDQGPHPAPGSAHPPPVGLEAGRGVGEGDGLRPRLRGVLQEHRDQGPEGDVAFQAQQPEHVPDGQGRRGGGQQARDAQDAEVVDQVAEGSDREAGGRARPPGRAPPPPSPATARRPDAPRPGRGRRRPRRPRTPGGRPRCRASGRAGGRDRTASWAAWKSTSSRCRRSPIGSPASRPISAVAPASKVNGPRAKIPRAATELGVRLQQRGAKPQALRQGGRREAPHAPADDDQVIDLPGRMLLPPGREGRRTDDPSPGSVGARPDDRSRPRFLGMPTVLE